MEKLSQFASAAEKISLGRQYEEMSGWLVQAFVDMVTRDEPPTQLEGPRLGIHDLVLIGQLRYRLQHGRNILVKEFVEIALKTPDEIIHMAAPMHFSHRRAVCKSLEPIISSVVTLKKYANMRSIQDELSY